MYIERIKNLPKPTPEQTNNFIQHVAKEHSWYKHLTAERTTFFVFYINPNAGRKMESTEERRFFFKREYFKFKDVREDTCAKIYQEDFGYWDYHVTEASMLQGELFLHKAINIFDSEQMKKPTSEYKLHKFSIHIPYELHRKLAFKMSRYIHPIFNNIHNHFDKEFPEKTFSQMHKEITEDLRTHLNFIVKTLYN